jgi:hypothetical protein
MGESGGMNGRLCAGRTDFETDAPRGINHNLHTSHLHPPPMLQRSLLCRSVEAPSGF